MFLSHRGVTCQLSALPLKAETSPRLSIRATVAVNNSPVLLYCLCWLNLHRVPWKLSSCRIKPTSFDCRWFCFYPWEFYGMAMPKSGTSGLATWVLCACTCVCFSPLALRFSKSNIQNRICQENEKLGLKTINMPDLELQKATSHKTILVKPPIFSPCWYYTDSHVYFSVKTLNCNSF